MSRLLFISSNRIGDAVLSTGVLEHARHSLGAPEVVVVCGEGPKSLFRAVPGLSRIETMKKRHGRWRDLWLSLRKERFDLAVDLRGSLVTYGLSARRRVVHRKSHMLRHKVEELAALLKVAPPPAPRLFLDAKAKEDADRLLGPRAASLILGPGAHFVGKRWPPERFIELAVRLAGQNGPLRGSPVVLMGGPDDAEIGRSIETALGEAGVPVQNVIGQLDLLAVAAAMDRAVLFVGNDSGLMHIAAAAGAPTVGLFGPSDERIYGPWGDRNRAVRGLRSYEELHGSGYMPLIEHSLMEDLPVDKVEQAALDVLGRGGLS